MGRNLVRSTAETVDVLVEFDAPLSPDFILCTPEGILKLALDKEEDEDMLTLPIDFLGII
jgi:hypothetical protein